MKAFKAYGTRGIYGRDACASSPEIFAALCAGITPGGAIETVLQPFASP
ncbi:MAG TPA: hypothetical protein PLD51_02415 [Pontiellaceae bacterium]|nr:hypothetical protein [Pontiellaceae bacterium]